MANLPPQTNPESPDGDPTLSSMYNMLTTMNVDGTSPNTNALYRMEPAVVATAVEAFEQRHFVESAPKLHEAAANPDDQQGSVVCYPSRFASLSGAMVETTESDALQEVEEFLDCFLAATGGSTYSWHKILHKRAMELKDGLFYMGQSQRQKAVAGTAARWRSMLEPGSHVNIFVPCLEGRAHRTIRGATEILLEEIMQHFPEDDPLRPRIQSGERTPDDPYAYTRVILLDDLVGPEPVGLSGRLERFQPPRNLYDIEINVLAASDAQLAKGIQLLFRGNARNDRKLPVYSYYNAGKDIGTVIPAGPMLLASQHLGNRECANLLDSMAKALQDLEPDQVIESPALARVSRARSAMTE